MNCCEDPKPRIATRSGRMFCASCRTYLEAPRQAASETLRDAQPDDATDNATDEGGDSHDAPAD